MLIFRRCLCLSLIVGVLFLTVSKAESLSELSHPLNLDPNQTSVSGLSSGAFMAVQLQVIYSKSLMGAGIIAGGPYRCAAGKYLGRWLDVSGLYAMLSICTHSYPSLWWHRADPDLAFSIQETERLAAAGLIDEPRHLAKQKIWMFSGAKDSLVPTQVMDTLQAYYQHFMPATNINYVKDVNASHGMITEKAVKPLPSDVGYKAIGGTPIKAVYPAVQYTV